LTVSNEGTKENQVHEGNDNVNMEEEEDELLTERYEVKKQL
jgi:hypothetical protein